MDWIPSSKSQDDHNLINLLWKTNTSVWSESSFHRHPLSRWTGSWDLLRVLRLWTPASLPDTETQWHQWYWRQTASGMRHRYVSSLQLSVHIWASTLEPTMSFYYKYTVSPSEDTRQCSPAVGCEAEYYCCEFVSEIEIHLWPWKQPHHHKGKICLLLIKWKKTTAPECLEKDLFVRLLIFWVVSFCFTQTVLFPPKYRSFVQVVYYDPYLGLLFGACSNYDGSIGGREVI